MLTFENLNACLRTSLGERQCWFENLTWSNDVFKDLRYHCAHQKSSSPAVTLTAPSLSSHYLGRDGDLSGRGGNHGYLHLLEAGSREHCLRLQKARFWGGSSCCLWLSGWSGKRASLKVRKQRNLESQLPSLDQIPSLACWNPVVSVSPRLEHLASLPMQTFFFVLLEELDP